MNNRNSHPHKIIALLIAALLLLFSSCNNDRIYYNYVGIEVDGWDKATHKDFYVSPISDKGLYNEKIGVRINSFYPFLTLNLIIEQTVYPSLEQTVDTIDCMLIDEDGRHVGHGQSLWQQEVSLKNIQLNKGDSIHINIRHNMRRDILRGITDLGFIIDKVQSR